LFPSMVREKIPNPLHQYGSSSRCSPTARKLRNGRDAVCAAPIARDDVFYPFNVDVRPQHRAEKVEFRLAKAFAGGCGRADRAVILDE
jgi:hypothetical protein